MSSMQKVLWISAILGILAAAVHVYTTLQVQPSAPVHHVSDKWVLKDKKITLERLMKMNLVIKKARVDTDHHMMDANHEVRIIENVLGPSPQQAQISEALDEDSLSFLTGVVDDKASD